LCAGFRAQGIGSCPTILCEDRHLFRVEVLGLGTLLTQFRMNQSPILVLPDDLNPKP